LDTDASDKAVGAVLSQQIDDNEHVIAYMSKALNKHETSYCTTRKELFAVITALKNVHSYIYGQNVLLRTDYAAVSWMRNLQNPTGQVARWLQELGTYYLQIEHRAERKHSSADALSRNSCASCKRQQGLQELTEEVEKENTAICEQMKEKDQVILTNIANHQQEDEISQEKQQLPVECQHKEESNENPEVQLTESVRAITRRKQETQSEEMKNKSFILLGWEPQDLRIQQLSDPDKKLYLKILLISFFCTRMLIS
jgi:hypothetical protein